MAVISNRAITLSDSLKNTVDTQASKTQMYWTMLYNTYVYWIQLKWPEKSEQEERKRVKKVGLNLLQPLHWYCGQCNTLSYRNQGSEPAKLDLVRKSKNCIDLMFFQCSGSTSKIPPRHIIAETKKELEILTIMKNQYVPVYFLTKPVNVWWKFKIRAELKYEWIGCNRK